MGAQTYSMTTFPEISACAWADGLPLIVDPMERKETSVDPRLGSLWGTKRKKEAVMNQRPLYTLIYTINIHAYTLIHNAHYDVL